VTGTAAAAAAAAVSCANTSVLLDHFLKLGRDFQVEKQ